MASLEQLEKMKVRQEYSNTWHTDLSHTMNADCPYCCFAVWCAPCASYLLRKRALYDDMSRYTCCAGYMPCSGKCGESKCPELCLWTEVCLCFGNSVSSTRFLLQDQFNIQTTQCDNCIIGFMFCIQQLACIFSIVACIVGIEELNELSRTLSCFADLVYCSVCACMQTQHKIELDKRDGKFECDQAMRVPPIQHMSRIDQPVPPSVGYPLPYPGGHGYPPVFQEDNHLHQPQGHHHHSRQGDHPQPPQGYPYLPPQGYPHLPPQGYPHLPPQGYPHLPPQGYPHLPPQGYVHLPPHGYPYLHPQGDPHHQSPQGYPHLPPQGDPHIPPQGNPHLPPQGDPHHQPPQENPHLPSQGDPHHQPPQGNPHLPPQGHHHHSH